MTCPRSQSRGLSQAGLTRGLLLSLRPCCLPMVWFVPIGHTQMCSHDLISMMSEA